LKYLGETASNIPESAMGLAKNLVQPILHPIETGSGLVDLAKATGNKLGRKAAEFVTGQELEPMPERSELSADVVGQGLKDRYGGVDQILNTIKTDPIGAWADVGGLGRVGGLGKNAEPISAAASAINKGYKGVMGSDLPLTAPERYYRSAAGIQKSRGQEGLDIAREGVDRRIGITEEGLDKLGQAKRLVGDQMDRIIDDATARNVRIPKTAITKYLDAMIMDDYYSWGAGELNTLKNMRSKFDEQFRYRNTLSAEEMQKWKTNAYERAYAKESTLAPTDASGISAKADRQMARGAREALEQRMPEIAGPNADWASLARLEPYIKNALDKGADSQSFWGAVKNTLASPSGQAKMAFALDKYKKSDFKSWLDWAEKNLNTNEIRAALVLSGRNQETLDETTVLRRPEIQIRNGVTE
jgi:hypothetical protein